MMREPAQVTGATPRNPASIPALRLQVFWFAVVGVIGFVVDAGVLQTLVGGFGGDPFAARPISFLAAASTTWFLNRWLTFRRRRTASLTEWGRYVTWMGVGAALNLGVFAAVVGWLGAGPERLLLALAAGTGAGMAVNFVSARHILLQCPGKRVRASRPPSMSGGARNSGSAAAPLETPMEP